MRSKPPHGEEGKLYMSIFEQIKAMDVEQLAYLLAVCYDVPNQYLSVNADDVAVFVKDMFGIPPDEFKRRYVETYGDNGNVNNPVMRWRQYNEPCEFCPVKKAGYCGQPKLDCTESTINWLNSDTTMPEL